MRKDTSPYSALRSVLPFTGADFLVVHFDINHAQQSYSLTSYSMSYVEDTFPVYRLDQADLEKYLIELHGSRDFHIEVRGLGTRNEMC
jgi:hypothetical protein